MEEFNQLEEKKKLIRIFDSLINWEHLKLKFLLKDIDYPREISYSIYANDFEIKIKRKISYIEKLYHNLNYFQKFLLKHLDMKTYEKDFNFKFFIKISPTSKIKTKIKKYITEEEFLELSDLFENKLDILKKEKKKKRQQKKR